MTHTRTHTHTHTHTHAHTLTLHRLLPQLPAEFAELPSLVKLELVRCGLETLSEHVISRLTRLRVLIVNNNKLASFPPLGECAQLRVLNISSNLLSSLPEGIADLPRLEKVDITFNRIETLSWDVLRRLPLAQVLWGMPAEYDEGVLEPGIVMRGHIVPKVV